MAFAGILAGTGVVSSFTFGLTFAGIDAHALDRRGFLARERSGYGCRSEQRRSRGSHSEFAHCFHSKSFHNNSPIGIEAKGYKQGKYSTRTHWTQVIVFCYRKGQDLFCS